MPPLGRTAKRKAVPATGGAGIEPTVTPYVTAAPVAHESANVCVATDLVAAEKSAADCVVARPSRAEKSAEPSDCVDPSVEKEFREAPRSEDVAASGTAAEPIVARMTKPGGAVTESVQSCGAFLTLENGAVDVVAKRGSEKPGVPVEYAGLVGTDMSGAMLMVA